MSFYGHYDDCECKFCGPTTPLSVVHTSERKSARTWRARPGERTPEPFRALSESWGRTW